jgi:signal recognition particle receptor subunit beta
MDRLKSARGAVGGKIEGMGHVSGGGGGWWARLFGGSGASAEAAEGQEAEEDEGLVWGGQGGWRWEDIEGVEVEWAASALGSIKDIKAEGVAGEGLDELKEFLWNL